MCHLGRGFLCFSTRTYCIFCPPSVHSSDYVHVCTTHVLRWRWIRLQQLVEHGMQVVCALQDKQRQQA